MEKTEAFLRSEKKFKVSLICFAVVSLFVFILHDTWTVNSPLKFYIGFEIFSSNQSRNYSRIEFKLVNVSIGSENISSNQSRNNSGIEFKVVNVSIGSENFSSNQSRNNSGIEFKVVNVSLSSKSDSYFCTDQGVTFDVTNSSFRVSYSAGAVMVQVKTVHKEAKELVKVDDGLCERRLPQCLIMGNFKCGTRELIDFMAMHPRIIIKAIPIYEIPFFGKLYYKGLQWYKMQMPCTHRNQITVAKDPEDFQDPLAPARIHAMNASMRLIVMVREPVARSISHFTFHKPQVVKYDNKLEHAVVSHRTGNGMGEIDPHNFFIKHSIYDEGMARYLKYFNRSQIKVILDEDFKRCPYQVLNSIEKFLNLEHTVRPDNFVFNKEKGYFCLRSNKSSQEVSCYDDSRGRNGSEVKDSVNDSVEFLQRLKNFFKPHNERFFKLAEREFDW